MIGLSTSLFTQFGPPDMFNAMFQSVHPVTQFCKSCKRGNSYSLKIRLVTKSEYFRKVTVIHNDTALRKCDMGLSHMKYELFSHLPSILPSTLGWIACSTLRKHWVLHLPGCYHQFYLDNIVGVLFGPLPTAENDLLIKGAWAGARLRSQYKLSGVNLVGLGDPVPGQVTIQVPVNPQTGYVLTHRLVTVDLWETQIKHRAY